MVLAPDTRHARIFERLMERPSGIDVTVRFEPPFRKRSIWQKVRLNILDSYLVVYQYIPGRSTDIAEFHMADITGYEVVSMAGEPLNWLNILSAFFFAITVFEIQPVDRTVSQPLLWSLLIGFSLAVLSIVADWLVSHQEVPALKITWGNPSRSMFIRMPPRAVYTCLLGQRLEYLFSAEGIKLSPLELADESRWQAVPWSQIKEQVTYVLSFILPVISFLIFASRTH